MHEDGKKLLNLMFRPDETVCVSPNKYGYHSIPLSALLNDRQVTLVPTQESCEKRKLVWEDCFEDRDTDDMLLLALNPIKGFRTDDNCTAFRNFLVEIDTGTSEQQMEYIKRMKMPYSAAIFSGNKSLHFLISLDEDLPNIKIYRFVAEWTLKVMTLADQMTKNPSRSIRIPGAFREPGKQQKLVEMLGPVKKMDLMTWLAKYPDAQPKPYEKKVVSEHHDFSRVKRWAVDRLINGLDPKKGRNGQWFAIAYEFALAGYELDATMDVLSEYFTPERDFKEREWKTTIRSAFKKIEDQ